MSRVTLKKYAEELGFDACGVARCRAVPEVTGILSEWVRRDFHAGMSYMEKHTGLRADPSRLYENTRSVVVCLMKYKTEREYPKGIPRIAAYARFSDYHFTVRQKLDALLARMKQIAPECEGRAFVDSAPIHEKHWAVEAGLGWIGKNTLLIHPELGSFCFIGIILTSLELDEYDTPYPDHHCGACRSCVDSCPTQAIRENGMVDSRRCLSYQTIENRGEIPGPLLPLLGDRLFGCDTCQEVCPRNIKVPATHHPEFTPDISLFRMAAGDWLEMTGGDFKRRFRHTPLFRTGLGKLKGTLSQKSADFDSINTKEVDRPF